MQVSWRSIAPIFASVVISPWNLLVGGLLIKHLSFVDALVAILIGHVILGIIFTLYGGLGYAKKQQSAQILGSIFPNKFAVYGIPLILALGQIGWAAINIDLGGNSLARLISLPSVWGIVFYSMLVVGMALLRLNQLGLVKTVIVVSSCILMAILFGLKVQSTPLGSFALFVPGQSEALFWGISIIVASLISFATVTPDFFKDVTSKQDILLATISGMMIPGVLTTLLGAFLFFNVSTSDVSVLISSLVSFAFFPQLFNTITNTDGAIALYTPGLKFSYIFKIPYRFGIVIAGLMSFLLALYGLASHLEAWLTILSVVFPSLIGVCFPALLFKHLKKSVYIDTILVSFFVSVVLSACVSVFFPSVIIALLTPLIVFSLTLSYRQLSVISL